MALDMLKDDNAENTGTNKKRQVSHFLNLYVENSKGERMQLDSVRVFDGGTKNQRTLIQAAEDPDFDINQLKFGVEVRANEKSTDVADVNEWL